MERGGSGLLNIGAAGRPGHITMAVKTSMAGTGTTGADRDGAWRTRKSRFGKSWSEANWGVTS